jgi:hypothetical protein
MPILNPPYTPTGAFHDGIRRYNHSDLWRFYGFNQGLAIVKINGVWTTAYTVDLGRVEEFYQGGMVHEISVEKANELTEAGFGEYIDWQNYDPPGYGKGPYGAGRYGY